MILLQFDAAYFHWGLLLVRSLALHERDQRVRADTVNLREAEERMLREAHPQIVVTNEIIAGDGPLRKEMARRKIRTLLSTLQRHPEEPWVALFDADMLVRQPLPQLWSLLDQHQAALLRTNGVWKGRVYPHLLICSSLVLVRRDGMALAEEWARWDRHPEPLHSIRPGEWFWDQVTLLQAWAVSQVGCATIPFDRFCGEHCPREAAIWSAHEGDKEQNYRYFLVEHELQRVRQTRTLP